MIEMTIETALRALGFDNGWAANDYGIILWENEEQQPSDEELVAAGWVKPLE
jgi:hypothetical protein